MNILWFIPILSVMMFVHEFGHFVTARLSGITVQEFGFGLPPRLWGFKGKNGVIYSINWIPFGAFVKMLGEEDPTAPGSFASKRRSIRAIVLAAGSAMNFLLAAMMEALAEAFTFAEKQGISRADLNNLIGQTTFACPAYQGYGRIIAERRFTPAGFQLPLGLKDIQLALQAAANHATPMPVAGLLRDRLLSAVAKGRETMDWSALALGAAEDAGLAV